MSKTAKLLGFLTNFISNTEQCLSLLHSVTSCIQDIIILQVPLPPKIFLIEYFSLSAMLREVLPRTFKTQKGS